MKKNNSCSKLLIFKSSQKNYSNFLSYQQQNKTIIGIVIKKFVLHCLYLYFTNYTQQKINPEYKIPDFSARLFTKLNFLTVFGRQVWQ